VGGEWTRDLVPRGKKGKDYVRWISKLEFAFVKKKEGETKRISSTIRVIFLAPGYCWEDEMRKESNQTGTKEGEEPE